MYRHGSNDRFIPYGISSLFYLQIDVQDVLASMQLAALRLHSFSALLSR